jgi:hypothetical protein
MALLTAIALLSAAAAPAQDEIESGLEQLADQISPDGLHGQLAGLLKTDHGRLAVREAIATLVTRVTNRYDRDPLTAFERHFFSEDEQGNLVLRPERQPELDRLVRRVANRVGNWPEFDAACQKVADAIVESDDLARRLKAYWSDPDFRLGLYGRIDPLSREPDADELFSRLIGRALFEGPDGKLRLSGPYRDEVMTGTVAPILGQLEQNEPYEEQASRVAQRLAPAGRVYALIPEGRLVIGGRLAVYAGEGAEDPIARLFESDVDATEAGPQLKAPIQEEISAISAVRAELAPIVRRTIAQMSAEDSGDQQVLSLLTDDRALAMLAANGRQIREERRVAREGAVNPFREDVLEEGENGALTARKGRFVNENGEDSVDAITNEYEGIKNELAATMDQFDEIASRVLDPALVELFESRAGSSALSEHLFMVIEELKQAARERGVERFANSFLIQKDGVYVIRPERERRVEAIARRAEEIRRGLEAAAAAPAGEVKKP